MSLKTPDHQRCRLQLVLSLAVLFATPSTFCLSRRGVLRMSCVQLTIGTTTNDWKRLQVADREASIKSLSQKSHTPYAITQPWSSALCPPFSSDLSSTSSTPTSSAQCMPLHIPIECPFSPVLPCATSRLFCPPHRRSRDRRRSGWAGATSQASATAGPAVCWVRCICYPSCCECFEGHPHSCRSFQQRLVAEMRQSARTRRRSLEGLDSYVLRGHEAQAQPGHDGIGSLLGEERGVDVS